MAQSQVSAKKQQELQQQYTTYKTNLQQLAERIGNVESETEEHKLVLETLTPLPQDRKCFRMINGVLVERTVKDVLPALQTNSDGLKKVLEELVKQYKRQQEEMEKWKEIVQPGDRFSLKKGNQFHGSSLATKKDRYAPKNLIAQYKSCYK
ncbi:MAG: hypothetical protein L6R39_006045 [Caloplaca ligustica]|nr:MAG: hypothetical protein L6R39_006045 [Caloplaca ligustica]